MSGNLFAVFTALYAAMIFGLLVHIQRKGLVTADPVAGAFVSVAAMTVSFWSLVPVFGGLEWFGHPAMIYFVIAGLAFPALGQFFQIQSVARVGPSLSAALGAFMPLFAALPAVLFLGEQLTGQMVVGFVAMTGGLQKREAADAPPGHRASGGERRDPDRGALILPQHGAKEGPARCRPCPALVRWALFR